MSEIQEAQKLLAIATFPAIKSLLQHHISYLQITADDSKAIVTEAAADEVTIDKSASSAPVISKPIVKSTNSQEVLKSNPSVAAVKVAVSHASGKGPSITYIPVEDFSWDQGEYGSNTVSVFVDLPGVGEIKDKVEFSCTKSSFDLKVTGLGGKNYRLIKDNLDKDIIVAESKIVVKKDKVVIKLRKLKGEYSYENWASLTSKKKRDSASEADKKANPMGGIMDMMKDMYDDGDANMKKIIGEAMMKSQRGEKADAPSFNDNDM